MADEMGMLTGADEVEGQPEQALSPAVVREVAEKVYALWLYDLRIERERLGRYGNRRHDGQRRK